MLGTVDVRTRPLRLAYLIDPKNEVQIREAIRLSSTLWGGAYFPIIPLYKVRPATWKPKPLGGPSAKDIVLGYLEAFDPDILVQFSTELPDYVRNIGLRIIKPEEVWSPLDKDGSLAPNFGIGIFELFNDIFAKYFRYISKYPRRVVIPKLPSELTLFWASWLGDLPHNIFPPLEETYSEALGIEVVDFDTGKLRETLSQNVFFPRRVAQYGLNHYNRSWGRGVACVYYLDGSKTEDIIDFWNLRALGRSVIPVPKQLRNEPQLKEIVAGFLKTHRRPRRHNPAMWDQASMIPARSSTMHELKEYAKTLVIEREPEDTSTEPFYVVQHWYPEVWDEWARSKVGEIPDDIYGDEKYSIDVREFGDIKLRALLPDFAEEYGFQGEPRCANEVSFRFVGTDEYIAEVFPKSFGQNYIRAISGITSFHDWRVGRNGLVKIVTGKFGEWRGMPTAQAVFFGWLSDRGWQPELSPPGLLAKQIYKRLLGNPLTLKDERLLRLLEYMNGGMVRKNLALIEKRRKRTRDTEDYFNQERDLTVGDVRGRLKTLSGDHNLHDYLISRGVFKLGIRVKCPRCLRESWFELENLRETLTCQKCLNSFPAIGNVVAPDWSYKTVGPFSVPRYAEGAYSVLLTLELLGSHRSSTMRATPVLSFKAVAPNSKDIEADFGMFWQEEIFREKSEGILLGECKTYGAFTRKDFARMRYLAKTFPRGTILVFSTLRKKLTKGEITGITRIAKAGRRHWKHDVPINPVLILTGTELLHKWSPPPYCWDDATQKKFSHVHGLVEICNATQQIYLGLPSWHEDWSEQWDKRRRRRNPVNK